MKNYCLTLITVLLSFASYAALPPITGTMAICAGTSTTLSNTVTGGTWSSGNPAVAAIIASTGVVTGLSAGTAAITYTDGIDFAYATVTVYTIPSAISGSPTMCVGGATTLSAAGGGTWSSSNLAVAPISAGGIATGVSAGVTTITYTLPTGCFTTRVVTVYPLPGTLTGSVTVCVGNSITLSSATPGGAWISTATAIATVNATGVVTGVTAGTSIISYTLGTGCSTWTTITVNPAPAPIAGTTSVCVGLTTTLTDATVGGFWSSSSPAIAFVGGSTGVVTGASVGTTMVSYTVGSGCSSTVLITVNTSGTITGTATLCAGAATTLTPTGGLGGTWTSSASSVATVGTGGAVFGLLAGTSTISYAAGSCGISTRVVTVTSTCSGTPIPGAITASSSIVCSGTAVALNLPAYTYVCGNVIQWQYSADGLSWSNLPGANTVPYLFYPTTAYYYRCGITCASSGLTGYSGPIHVTVNFAIGTSSVISTPSTTCDPTHFYVAACGVSPTFSVTTSFGDGTSTTTALSTTTLSDAHIYHTYTSPGTYTVQHVLFNGATPVDTVTFSYNYLYCRTLPIRFYMDNNSNCIYDAGDVQNVVAVATQVDSNGVHIDTITATTGFYYKALGAPGTVYAFRPISVAGGMAVTCPSAGVIYDTISSYTNTYVTKHFGITCSASASFDLRVSATSVCNPIRETITIVVSNFYCTSVSPVVTLSMSPKYNYAAGVYPCSYTYPFPTSVSGTTMTWNLSPMAANSTQIMTVYLYRPSTLGAPLVLGDTVNTTISVSPTIGDVNAANNIYTKLDTVRAPMDPNDIAVNPEGYILPCTKLEYKVRFENMGNDTAHNVYVLDTLSDYLDASSLAVDIASAPMTVSVINDGVRNIARFDFPNIKLLDSSQHGRNNGMFIFNIKAKNGLTDGTAIMNRVGIYFDYNSVVMTNSVTNVIGIAPIIGPGNVCLGYPAQFINSTAGGVWASSTPTVATITSTGAAAAVIAGTSVISYTVTNSCTSRTATSPITVAAVVTPSVSITSSLSDTVCAGSSVVFSATTGAAGTSPGYTWRVNGISVGAGSTYTYTPATSDTVTLSLASSAACAIPSIVGDTLPMTVVAMETPSVGLSLSPGDTICAGNPVTFTAGPVFGGDAPGYLWFVNGTVAGSGGTFIYPPANGDVVYCRMGSSFMCRIVDTVNSSNVTMTVDPLYIPFVTIVPSPSLYITAGDPLTLTAVATGTGPTPTYQWVLNGFLIAGATNSSYTSTTFHDYDSVTCKVTGSGICNITSFNSVYITVYPVGVANVTGGDELHLFPNPNKGGFNIKGTFGTQGGREVEVIINNVMGQVVYRTAITTGDKGAITGAIHLPQDIANGMYILNLRADSENKMFRFVIDK